MIALVTGANRGIGRAVAEALARAGHSVLVGSRELASGQKVADALVAQGLAARAVALDVAQPGPIDADVDILVNNAGIYPQGDVLSTDLATFREAFEVHFFGPLRLCQQLVPGMKRRRFGRIVNVSSGYGAISEGLEGSAAYALSKAALNALTIKLASEVGSHIKVNAVCPGWVHTRMGGRGAPRSPQEAADTIVWLATLPDDGPSGGFFRYRQQIPW